MCYFFISISELALAATLAEISHSVLHRSSNAVSRSVGATSKFGFVDKIHTHVVSSQHVSISNQRGRSNRYNTVSCGSEGERHSFSLCWPETVHLNASFSNLSFWISVPIHSCQGLSANGAN